jgi:hypothetical protein
MDGKLNERSFNVKSWRSGAQVSAILMQVDRLLRRAMKPNRHALRDASFLGES